MRQDDTCICILIRVYVQSSVFQFLLQQMMYTVIQENAKRRWWATKVQIRFQIELATILHDNIYLLKLNQVVYRNS